MSWEDKEGHTQTLDSGAALVPRNTLSIAPGEYVGRFRVLAPLGQGGMGTVLLAEDEKLERKVALKLVLSEMPSDTERERFLREARSAAALSHPNIAAVYDIGEYDQRPFIAMEYVEGPTLSKRLHTGPLEVDALIEIAQQLAAALAAAHSVGVIHRDIKPGNVMLSSTGAKLLDFGLAKAQDAKAATEQLTQTGALLGTPAYMSPEQALGKPVDARSDVFALGTLLYEAATRRCPFEADSVFGVLNAVIHEDPPAIFIIRADTPTFLVSVIERCMAKDPEARFASCVEVAAALDMRGSQRVRVQARQGLAEAESRVALLPFKNLTQNPEHDWVGAGLVDTLSHELKRSFRVLPPQRVAPVAHALSPTALGQKFGVDWVVHGSFQVAGARVRITTTAEDIIHTRSLSLDRVDGRLEDIFDLQDTLVAALKRTLTTSNLPQDTLTPNEPIVARTRDLQAYEWYARGVTIFNKHNVKSIDDAVACFQAALEKDPQYALAYTGLGSCQFIQFLTGGAPQLLTSSIQHLEQAQKLDPFIAETQRWLAHILAIDGRYEQALVHGARACELDPEDSMAWSFYGIAHIICTQQRKVGPTALIETHALFKRAIELDPKATGNIANQAIVMLLLGELDGARELTIAAEDLLARGQAGQPWVGVGILRGLAEIFADELDTAREHLLHGLKTVQDDHAHFFAPPVRILGLCSMAEIALRKGQPSDAMETFRQAHEDALQHEQWRGMWHHTLKAELGKAKAMAHISALKRDARALLESTLIRWRERDAMDLALRDSYASFLAFTAFDVASCLATLGERDEAIATLQEAFDNGWACHHQLDTDPAFDTFRTDPRLQAIRDAAASITLA